MPYKDPAAHKAQRSQYMKEYLTIPANYKKHRKRVRKNNNLAKAESRRIVVLFKAAGCALCPEKEPCCLSAHHLFDKNFSVAEAQRRRISPRRILEELKKCICLCENCHRKVHAGVVTLTAGTAPWGATGLITPESKDSMAGSTPCPRK